MSIIYVPYADIEDTASDLVKQDLIIQVRCIVQILMDKIPCRPEWLEHRSTLAYIGTLYVELLQQKYNDRSLNSTRNILAIGMIGTHDMPEWTAREDIHLNHRGFLKFLGLCRVYHWRYRKRPPQQLLKYPDRLAHEVKKIALPAKTRPDYSQYDVPLCNTFLRLKS